VEPKDRIINAASQLFAQKGYASVGVREIAKKAEVNSAMISYYFGGKLALLVAIMDRFFELYVGAIETSFKLATPLEERVFALVKNLVTIIREHPNIFKIGFLELPYDIPEIAAIRGEKINMIRTLLGDNVFSELMVGPKAKEHMPIIGPAIMNMVFSNFIMGPSIQSAFQVQFDDEFYRMYARTITSLIMRGLPGCISSIESMNS
jgi:AcrR family transcriptional regulator